METSSLLEAFEQADRKGKRALLKSNGPLEGFSEQYFLRVARLLGEDPAASRRLAESWDIVEQLGDNPSFAWRAKGALGRMRGRWLESAEAFVRAGKTAQRPIDQLSFPTGAIDSYARAGRTQDAVRLGRSIASKLESHGEIALAGRAWLNTGNACLWTDDHRRARKFFEKAVECLTDSPFQLELAMSRLGLSTSALYIDYPSRSFSLAEAARDELNGIGMPAYANHAEVNLGQCYLLMGQADQAVREFAGLRDKADADDLEFARLGQFLGDAWLALQVYVASLDAYQSAIASPGVRQSPLNHANCYVGVGDVSLMQGQPAVAKKSYRRAWSMYDDFGNKPLANLAKIGVAKSEIALGRRVHAIRILDETIVDLRKRGMHQFLVDALLSYASIAGREKSVEALNEAERFIKKYGFVDEAWKLHSIRAELAHTEADAIRAYRKMVDAILAHRSRLTSVTGRTTLLEPCLRSIRTYLELLLERGTKASRAEAIRVVSVLRSATILDEFLSTNRESIPESVRLALEDLRAEAAADEKNNLPGGPLRLSTHGGKGRPQSLRAYLETVGVERISGAAQATPDLWENPTNTFVFLNQGAAWLQGERGLQLKVGRRELVDRLRWIQFELMAPLSGFLSDDERLESELTCLKEELRLDTLLAHGAEIPLCVEDIAYQVAWPILVEGEPVLYLRPQGGVSPQNTYLYQDSKVAIWYFPRPELPHIEEEVEQLRSFFPNAKMFTTREEVLDPRNQVGFDLIHVAAHGRYDHENPMFSSIELADGHMLACDIARAGFSSRIATLASCESASLGQPSGWEPQGLARAFLARRCQTVIGSLWPLNDRVAKHAFGDLYWNLLSGCSISEAMATTRNKLKAEFVHPAYWGSLIMFGGYSI